MISENLKSQILEALKGAPATHEQIAERLDIGYTTIDNVMYTMWQTNDIVVDRGYSYHPDDALLRLKEFPGYANSMQLNEYQCLHQSLGEWEEMISKFISYFGRDAMLNMNSDDTGGKPEIYFRKNL